MIKKPLDDVKEINLREHLKHLQEESKGRDLELSAAPTADDPLLEDGEAGVYGGIIYSRIGDTIYVVTPSSTITIT